MILANAMAIVFQMLLALGLALLFAGLFGLFAIACEAVREMRAYKARVNSDIYNRRVEEKLYD